MSARKRFLFWSILIGLTLAGIALIVSAYYGLIAWRFYQQNSRDYIGDSFVESDDDFGYGSRASVQVERRTPPAFRLFTDDRGCRVNGSGDLTSEEVDLLALGGSFTWGYGVDNEDTFVQQISRDGDLRVCNAAFPAYGTTAALLTMREYADLAPDIVVYGFIRSHVDRSVIPCAVATDPFCRSVAQVAFDASGEPFVRPPQPMAEAHSRYLNEAVLAHEFGLADIYWAMQRDWLRFGGQDAQSLIDEQGLHRDGPARRVAMRYLIDALAEESAKLAARLVVVYIPFPGDIHPVSEELSAVLADHPEIIYVDLEDAFTAYEAQHGPLSLKVTEDDNHPNAEAHRLIAEALAPILEDLR